MSKKFLILLLLLLPSFSLASSISDFSPVAHWTYDEYSGVRYDSTNNSNDLTDYNTVGYQTGLLSQAADFEDSNAEGFKITDADQVGLDITGDHSISAWVKLESLPSTIDNFTIAGKSNWSGNNRAYKFYLGTSNQVAVFLSEDGTGGNRDFFYTASNAVTTGVWYHIVYTYDLSERTGNIYLNNVLQSVTHSNLGTMTQINDTPASFTSGFGNYLNTYENFDGLIDELTVFDYTLSSSDVSTLYNSGVPLSYESSVSSVQVLPFPYNDNMPRLQTITDGTATYTLNYATSTEVYMTPDTLAITLLCGLLFGLLMGYFAYKNL